MNTGYGTDSVTVDGYAFSLMGDDFIRRYSLEGLNNIVWARVYYRTEDMNFRPILRGLE